MEDKRFNELFTNPNFQINPDSEEFRLLNPVVQKNNEKRLKRKAVVIDSDQVRIQLNYLIIKLVI
jgi:ribosome biogenesis protein ENP2